MWMFSLRIKLGQSCEYPDIYTFSLLEGIFEENRQSSSIVMYTHFCSFTEVECESVNIVSIFVNPVDVTKVNKDTDFKISTILFYALNLCTLIQIKE